MVTETAIISAAMATAVRLSELTTLRGAMRPSTPPSRLLIGVTKSMASVVTSGVSMAKPMMMANVPAKPTTSLWSAAPAGPARRPSAPGWPAQPPTARPALLSRPERERATRGGTEAASQAGGAAASTVAITPSTTPLTRLLAGSTPAHGDDEIEVVDRLRHRAHGALAEDHAQDHPQRRAEQADDEGLGQHQQKYLVRVTPRQRRVPKSGRRCTTEKVMVL